MKTNTTVIPFRGLQVKEFTSFRDAPNRNKTKTTPSSGATRTGDNMTSTRARKLTFAVLSTAILMAVIAALLFATPNGAFAAGPERPTDLVLSQTCIDRYGER